MKPNAPKLSMADARKRVLKSRVDLVWQQPFFGALALRLKVAFENGLGTAATDGQTVWFDPEFVGRLNELELNTVMAHEVMHCALLHHVRRGNRDPKLFNIAADHATNLALEDAVNASPTAFAWPTDPQPLKDPLYRGMSAEEIYAKLYVPPKPGGCGNEQGQGNSSQGSQNGPGEPGNGQPDPGGMGGVKDAPKPKQTPGEVILGDDALAKSEAEWKTAVIQAAQAAKLQGKLPAGIASLVEELVTPRVPWTDVLRRWIQERAKDDWSWSRPNRRIPGVILPGLDSQRCGPIVLCIDTSGSCVEYVPSFLSEAQAILDEVRPTRLTVLDIDADLGKIRDYLPGDCIDMDYTGGGGTDFRPAFVHVEQTGEQPVGMVYLTDLYGTFPESAPDYPVLWVVTSAADVPFGEVIRINS